MPNNNNNGRVLLPGRPEEQVIEGEFKVLNGNGDFEDYLKRKKKKGKGLFGKAVEVTTKPFAEASRKKGGEKLEERYFEQRLFEDESRLPPSLRKSFRKSRKKELSERYRVEREAAEVGIPIRGKALKYNPKTQQYEPDPASSAGPKSTAQLKREILLQKQFEVERKVGTEAGKKKLRELRPGLVRTTARGAAVGVVGAGHVAGRLTPVGTPRRRRPYTPSISGIRPSVPAISRTLLGMGRPSLGRGGISPIARSVVGGRGGTSPIAKSVLQGGRTFAGPILGGRVSVGIPRMSMKSRRLPLF